MSTAFRSHVARATEIVGGQSELARRIGMTQAGVHYLCHEADAIKAEWAVKIEEATDGKVSRSELRPDIFPPSPPSLSQGDAA